MKVHTMLAAGMLVAACAAAQDAAETTLNPVVVSATRTETPARELGSSLTVISPAAIDASGKATVSELLRSVPGLDVVRSGGAGQLTAVFLRGAKSEHTLVLIDGVEANDPIAAGRTYNFSALTAENIERIEILRGPQSTLYGSDAIAGVVNIITRKDAPEPGLSLFFEGGSFRTFRENLELFGPAGRGSYRVSVSRTDTEGISAAEEDDGNREKDGFANTSLSARWRAPLSEATAFDVTVRAMSSEHDLDNRGGPGGDDPNYTFTYHQVYSRAALTIEGDAARHDIGAGVAWHDRDYENGEDAEHPGEWSDNTMESLWLRGDWQSSLPVGDAQVVTVGAEVENERGETRYTAAGAFGAFTSTFDEQDVTTLGAYAQDQVLFGEHAFVTVGARWDEHSEFGSEVTYRVAPVVRLGDTGCRVKGTYGTGFKAPTLYQLFDPANGNPGLDPETSRSWDLGVEQVLWDGRADIGVTYFFNEYEDLIEWTVTDFATFSGSFMNTQEAESKGVEVVASARPTEHTTVTAHYTRTETEDKTTGEMLIRRPEDKAGITVTCRPVEALGLTVDVTFVGDREDTDFNAFPAQRVTLESYTLARVAATWDAAADLQFHARVENVLDEDYQEVVGFGTPGLAAYAGVRKSF